MMRSANAVLAGAQASALCIAAVTLAAASAPASAVTSEPAIAVTPTPASPAGWSVQPTPSPPGAGSLTILLGVSCSSLSACTAVGDHVSGQRRSTVAERWDGTRWVAQSTPGANRTFAAVACPAARECLAVGGADQALAERWDGTQWRDAAAAQPAGSGMATLTGVSCPGPATCIAVGSYLSGNNQRPLAERWNGRTWTVQNVAKPAGFAVLSGISCTGPSACTAVGTYARGRSQLVFAERWDGRAWTPQPVPAPPGIPILASVSCAAADSCTAVGLNVLSTSVGVLADHWDGRRWTAQHVPAPAGQGPRGLLLQGVSCSQASMCIAVGSYSNRAGIRRVLTEIWNGSRWAVLAAPNPSAKNSQLLGVSCLPPGTCLAVGGYSTQKGSTATLAESR